jgi:arginyl-tRNA synthetase
VRVTPEDLAVLVARCLMTSVERLGGDVSAVPVAVTVERPRNPEHGDYATNAAMQTGKRAGLASGDLAAALAECLRGEPGVADASLAGPGFVNVTLDAAAAGALAATIVAAGDSYGRSDALAGRAVNIEFISANPTGPLHLGHTRWAALGDALARVLSTAGAKVTREFYVNDRGAQLDRFGESLMAVAHVRPVPPDGYHGQYIRDLAAQIVSERPDILSLPEDLQVAEFREEGYHRQLAEQQQQLRDFRTVFDVWTSERQLHSSGRVAHGIDVLQGQGHLYEADGALFMRTSDFGDDKDRVLVKQDGEYTYFASDTAYYVDKRERGFDSCLYLLGADHHGYVGRLKAIAACAGDDPEQTLDVLIGQLVTITRGGQEMRLSKRAGTIVTLQDIVDIAGVDAVRYSLCRYPADSPMTLDLDLVTRQSADNPVFYVQYAHARLSSILRNAADLGVELGDLDPALLDHPREAALLGALGEYPRVVATAAELREPHRVARYLEDTAATFHKFYDECRVLPQGDEDTTARHRARLWLVTATRQVIANGLTLLGVEAPDRM